MLLATFALTNSSNAQVNPDLVEDSGFIRADSGSLAVTQLPQFDSNLNNDANTVFTTVTITEADVDFVNNGGDITDVFFTIEGLTHSHLSDLTVRVEHLETNRIATLFERVGISDTNGPLGTPNGFIDNQNIDGVGSNANVSGTYRFQDDGASLFDAAAATADGAVVPTLGAAGSYAASGSGNGLVSLFNAFARDTDGSVLQLEDIVGDYQFSISDRSSLTTDTLVAPAGVQSFTRLNVSFQAAATGPGPVIPEPGSAAGMLLAMIGLAARRRRA